MTDPDVIPDGVAAHAMDELEMTEIAGVTQKVGIHLLPVRLWRCLDSAGGLWYSILASFIELNSPTLQAAVLPLSGR